jgi:xanthine dehydrogenase accessory factor
MAVTADGSFVGSVSGGCVEGAVIERAVEVMASGEPALVEFGVDDELAWSVGLSCGGRIAVLVEPFPSFSTARAERDVGEAMLEALRQHKPITIVSRIGLNPTHWLVHADGRIMGPDPESHDAVKRAATSTDGRSRRVDVAGEDLFVHVIRGKEVLLIIGATDIATHLVRLARPFGFESIVIDPREAFTDPSRFEPAPDRLLTMWPDDALADIPITGDTYAVLLSHNPRVDDPALTALLNAEPRYVGALGGRKTQQRRRARMIDAGFSEDQVDQIHGPVGLDIGASSPAEIALSIMAEIIAARNGLRI